jgi:hypothetical protein
MRQDANSIVGRIGDPLGNVVTPAKATVRAIAFAVFLLSRE